MARIKTNRTDVQNDALYKLAATLLHVGIAKTEFPKHFVALQVAMQVPEHDILTCAGKNTIYSWLHNHRQTIEGYATQIAAGTLARVDFDGAEPFSQFLKQIAYVPAPKPATKPRTSTEHKHKHKQIVTSATKHEPIAMASFGPSPVVRMNAPTQHLPGILRTPEPQPQAEQPKVQHEPQEVKVEAKVEIDYDLLADKIYQRFIPGLSRIADAIIDAMPKFDQSKLISKDDVLELIALLDAQSQSGQPAAQVQVVGAVAESAPVEPPQEPASQQAAAPQSQEQAPAESDAADSEDADTEDADEDPLDHQPPASFQPKEMPKHVTLLAHELNKPKPMPPISIVVYGLQTQQEDRLERAYKKESDVVKLIFVRDATRLGSALAKADTAVAMSSYMTQQARQQLHDREKNDRSFKYHTISGAAGMVQRTISDLVEKHKLEYIRLNPARH